MGPHGEGRKPTPLQDMPDDHVFALMAFHLKARGENPVGSILWGYAVLGYENCKRELDRRLIERIVEAAREREGELPE